MKYVFLAVIFFTCFSIYSQTFREVKIYVPPVEGSGRTEADNSFFFRQIAYEVISRQNTLVRVRNTSDFILNGKILSVNEILSSEELSNLYSNLLVSGSIMEYIFLLELFNTTSNEIIGRQSIIYNSTDESAAELVSIMVFNMLSVIPEIEVENNWYNNRLYIELKALWAPRIYTSEYQSIHWFNFGIGITAEYHFSDFLSLDTGVQFTQDWVVISAAAGNEERDLILEVPLALKLVIKPVNFAAISPYAGIFYNYSVMNKTRPSDFSAFAGLEVSLRAGPGMITINPRFSFDLSISTIPGRIEYTRYMMQIGIGYKIGFFPKNN